MAAKIKFIVFVFVLGGLGLVFLILGFSGYKFLNYQRAGLDSLQNDPRAVVVITSPQAFAQESEKSSLPVNVTSNGYQPLVSTELWVDGILMGVQAAPAGGVFNFNTTFLWSPGPAGDHSLVARTLDIHGDMVMSAPVELRITKFQPPAGTDSAIPFDVGPAGVQPLAAQGGGNAPGVDAPGPNDSQIPAKVGQPTIGDWVADITNSTPPQAPGLSATMDGCIVTLHIHDLSENEAGFQVFRSLLGAPAWTKLAELNSQSATGWISYADELSGPAKGSYYVAALNGAGQAISNPVELNLTSPGCPAPENDQDILVIEPISFHIDAAIDQAYCYKSQGGLHWERWPGDGFFLPGADGFDIQPYQMTFALNGLDGEPLIDKLDLYVECWGWAGSELTNLGKIHFASTDLFDLGEQEQGGGIFTMDANFIWSKYDPYDKFLTAPPESADMPFIYAYLTYNPQVCKDHLPGEFQNAWGAFDFCTPFPEYTLGPGTANPQPYLVWSVEDECAHDFSGVACESMASLMATAEGNGGNVFFSVYDQNDYIDHFSFVEAPFTSHVVTPLKCKGTRTYTVKMIYTDAANHVEGPHSNEVSIPCLVPPPVTQAQVDVTFETLTLTNVDDDDGPPEDVELYGFFQATSSDGSHGIRNLGYWYDIHRPGDCLDEELEFVGSFSGNAGSSPGGCEYSYHDATYSISDMPLCTSDVIENCVINISQGTDWLTHNNIIHLTVGDGDSIVLVVGLIDHDSDTSNDPACFGIITTSSNTAQGWANGTVNFTIHPPDFANGGCTVQGTISATP